MRLKALRLCGKNWIILIALMIVQNVIAFACYKPILSFVTIPILNWILSVAFMALLYPLDMGVIYIYLNIWRGNPTSFGDYFSFYRTKQTVLRALKLGLVYALVQYAANLPIMFLRFILPDISQSGTVISVVAFVLQCVSIWMSLRLFLMPYLMIEGHCVPIKESYTRMSGRVVKLIGFELSLFLWTIPIIIAFMVISVFSVFTGGQIQENINFYYTTGMQWLIQIVAPFIGIAMAGYACDVVLKPPERYPAPDKLQIKDVYRKK